MHDGRSAGGDSKRCIRCTGEADRMHAIRSAYIDGVYQSADCMNEISLLDTCIHHFLPHDSVVAVVAL